MIYNEDKDFFELEKKDILQVVLLMFFWPFCLVYQFIKYIILSIKKGK